MDGRRGRAAIDVCVILGGLYGWDWWLDSLGMVALAQSIQANIAGVHVTTLPWN